MYEFKVVTTSPSSKQRLDAISRLTHHDKLQKLTLLIFTFLYSLNENRVGRYKLWPYGRQKILAIYIGTTIL